VHVETEGDPPARCAELVNEVRDQMRVKYMAMMGCEELLKVKI
jgi:hypothetical protein